MIKTNFSEVYGLENELQEWWYLAYVNPKVIGGIC